MSYLLGDPTFWAAVGLVAFFGILVFFGVPKVIMGALDSRSEKIRNELDEARRLREEAQEMLASYERKQREAAKEAEEIIKQAKHDADLMRANAKDQVAQRIERRTAMAEQRIAQAEAQATREVRTLATDLAIEAASSLMKDKLSKADRNALVKGDTDQIKSSLN